jgi:hypothetical protein
MRLLAVVLATSLVTGGCVANSYQIPNSELQKLAQQSPEQRAQHVRVIQEVNETDVPAAQRVDGDTQVVGRVEIEVPVGGGGGPRPHTPVHGGTIKPGHGGGLGSLGGNNGGGDGKAAAVAFLVIAASALVLIAGIEGSRFDGYAQLHPMHPVHLIGKDGSYQVVPLAWIDPATAAWTDKAIVKPSEGPWHPLERAPLSRTGGTYGMFAGTGQLRSVAGDLALGPAFTVQAGFFPEQHIGIVGSVFFGWRDNQMNRTLFESRYMLELQALPVAAGIFHAGLYGGAGFAYRFEDGFDGGNSGSHALAGGAMFQLDVNTRLGLTARLGVTQAHDEIMRDILVGLAVY